MLDKVHNMLEKRYQAPEFRSNVKLFGAGGLALILWILLASLAWNHFKSSRGFAEQLSKLGQPSKEQPSLLEQPSEEQITLEAQISLIEKSADMVDSTADRLYTFLTPIVTAITGYFFVASNSIPIKSSNVKEEIDS